MNGLAKSITKHKNIVVFTFLILAILSGILSTQVNVNQSMLDYLPEDSESTVALRLMEEEFDSSVPNASIMVSNVSLSEALEYKQEISEVEGVDSITWLDDVYNLTQPIEMASESLVEQYYKEETALFSVTIASEMEQTALDSIRTIIGEDNAMSGDAVDTYYAQKMSSKETTGAMLILIPVIIIILLLTTTSWLEPALFLITVGVAVIINMGCNAFLGTISSITQTVTPILQLAVSLDYAIFLLHSFESQRGQYEDMNQAMIAAIKKSFPAIAASAATTLFGFLALVFMKFGIGSDLGLNLAKAIVISYISVMVFLPALTLKSIKLLDRTRHKKIIPEFKGIGKVFLKIRIPALLLVIAIIVPAYLAQKNTDFYYGMGAVDPTTESGANSIAISDQFGTSNAMVILVPKGDVSKEKLVSDELLKQEHVTSVLSYASTVGTVIPEEYLDEATVSTFYSDNYARIIAYTDTESEDEVAFQTVEEIRAIVAKYYETSYSCGQSANLYDMKTVVSADNTVVNMLAITAIAVVLIVTFKAAILPFLLLFVIESAIWINLAVPYFMGDSLCYIGYLVINTVQLGATIDYAILMNESYMKKRKSMPKKQAMAETIGDNFISILTSALILTSAGVGLYMNSTNNIIISLGALLARGTVLSFVLVNTITPAIILLFDRVIEKTTWRSNFYHK